MADSGLEAMLAAGGGAQEEAAAGVAAASEAVPAEELVPHIARGANTAIYGYDIANMKERPWAQPGANLADYFNYDFDEASYRAFCAMHAQGSSSVKLKAEQYVTKLFGADAAPQHAAGSGGEQPMHHQHGGYGQQGAYGRGPQGAGAGGNLIPRAKLHKTKPCYAFRDGLCQRGDTCPYAHGEQELQHGRAQLAAYEAEFGGGHGGHGHHHHGHHSHQQHHHGHHHHHHHQQQHHQQQHHHHGHSHHQQHQYGMQQHRPQPPAEGRPEGVLGGPPASAPAPAQAPAPVPAHVPKGDEGLFEAPPGPG